MKKFWIELHVSHLLSVDQLWPDHDAPENPTVEDVELLLGEEGDVTHVLSEWNLDYGLKFEVREAWSRESKKLTNGD